MSAPGNARLALVELSIVFSKLATNKTTPIIESGEDALSSNVTNIFFWFYLFPSSPSI